MHQGSAGASPEPGGRTVPKPESRGQTSNPADASFGQGEVLAQARNVSKSTKSSEVGQEKAHQLEDDSRDRPAPGSGEAQLEEFLGYSPSKSVRSSEGEVQSIGVRSDNPLGNDSLIDLSDDEPDTSPVQSTVDVSIEELRGEKPKTTTRTQAKDMISTLHQVAQTLDDSFKGQYYLNWRRIKKLYLDLDPTNNALADKIWFEVNRECEHIIGHLENLDLIGQTWHW